VLARRDNEDALLARSRARPCVSSANRLRAASSFARLVLSYFEPNAQQRREDPDDYS
jgi:hypothetical protein